MALTTDMWSDADMCSVLQYLKKNKRLVIPAEVKAALGMAG